MAYTLMLLSTYQVEPFKWNKHQDCLQLLHSNQQQTTEPKRTQPWQNHSGQVFAKKS